MTDRRPVPPGEHCGGCGDTMDSIIYDSPSEPDVVPGDDISCHGCGAIHLVREDGIQFTGDYEPDRQP